MGRSKYIADHAVETARLCVLKATAAERLAMEAKQEAEEHFNDRAAAKIGVDAASAGYKAAQAGQHATVIGQQAAVWEDPNLPPQDTIRQLEYVIRLIDSVIDKAAEVAYNAAQIAPNLGDPSKKLVKECTVKQSTLKRQVHLSTRKLANILASRDEITKRQKPSKINSEAKYLVDFIIEAEEIENDTEETQVQTITQKFQLDQGNSLIDYVVTLANQQVVLANYVCALTALQLPRVSLENTYMRKRNNHIRPLRTQEDLGVYNISRRFASEIKEIIENIQIIAEKSMEIGKTDLKQPILYNKEPNPIVDMELIIMKNKIYRLSKNIFTVHTKEAASFSQQMDEMMAQATQAIDHAVAKAAQLIHMDIAIVEANELIHSYKRVENLIDQISTLASRVAILAYQERLVVWGEYNDKEKDDPQVLAVVAQQADKVANEAAQAATLASQAANRAGQSVTQLIHDLRGNLAIRLATLARTWHVLPSDASTTSLAEVKRMCWEADTACKDARDVYEKIEQARRDAEQFCTRGIIAAQPVSWWSIWPWLLSTSFKQSEEAAKQSSEALDQVGQAAVLAGQAVAQSGLAVTQASQAVATLGQIVTGHLDSHSPLPLRKEAFPLEQIVPIAQQIGVSIALAGQTAAQARQAAYNVALAAQTTQKAAKIAQAVQQIEWLKKWRQIVIFLLGVLLSLVSTGMLFFTPIITPDSPTFNSILVAIGTVAIVDNYLLLTCLVENIQKMTRMFHKLVTLICCALLCLLAGFVIFDALLLWVFQNPPNDMTRAITSILIALLIMLPPFITGVVYYQHCTLNDLHPYDVPTSALES